MCNPDLVISHFRFISNIITLTVRCFPAWCRLRGFSFLRFTERKTLFSKTTNTEQTCTLEGCSCLSQQKGSAAANRKQTQRTKLAVQHSSLRRPLRFFTHPTGGATLVLLLERLDMPAASSLVRVLFAHS